MTTSSRPATAAPLRTAVEHRDDRLAALEREPLLPDELGLQEALERLGRVEPLEHVQLQLGVGLLRLLLDPLLDPLALLGVLDVHVLDADVAAVGVAQHAEHVAQLHHAVGRRSRRPGTRGRGPTASGRG